MLSPGGKSYDAIGWMKHINEQTSAQYANAHDILGNERDENKENQDPQIQSGKNSKSASDVLVELCPKTPLSLLISFVIYKEIYLFAGGETHA